MTSRLRVAAVAGLLVATVAAGVTGPTGGASAGAADPAYEAPVVGQCHHMDADELAGSSYSEAAVDCAGPHTSVTIAVELVPAGPALDSRSLERFALGTCLPAQRRALGTTARGMRLTAYDVGWFVPTPEQQAAGARWVRCDLVLGDPGLPQPLPSRVRVGRPPYDDAVARCLAGPDHRVTVCSARHTHRASEALRVGSPRLPNEKGRTRIGEQRCRGAVGSRAYRFAWPSRAAWQAGDRTLICYTQTRR